MISTLFQFIYSSTTQAWTMGHPYLREKKDLKFACNYEPSYYFGLRISATALKFTKTYYMKGLFGHQIISDCLFRLCCTCLVNNFDFSQPEAQFFFVHTENTVLIFSTVLPCIVPFEISSKIHNHLNHFVMVPSWMIFSGRVLRTVRTPPRLPCHLQPQARYAEMQIMRRGIWKFSSHVKFNPGFSLRRTTSRTRTGICSCGCRQEEGSEVFTWPDFWEEGQGFEDQDIRGLRDHADVCVPAPGLPHLRRGARDGAEWQHGRPGGPRQQGGLRQEEEEEVSDANFNTEKRGFNHQVVLSVSLTDTSFSRKRWRRAHHSLCGTGRPSWPGWSSGSGCLLGEIHIICWENSNDLTLLVCHQVCGGVSGQCQVWRHHVRALRHRDPARDRDQQPAAQAQAAAGHPGDGVPHLALGPRHLQDHPRLRWHEPRVDRQWLAAQPRPISVQDHLHGVSCGCKVRLFRGLLKYYNSTFWLQDAGSPHQERPEGPVEAGGQLPPHQPHVRDQVPQAPQLRQRRPAGEAEGGRGRHQGRPGLVQRQGHEVDSRHRSQGENKHLALKVEGFNIWYLTQDFANNLIESGVHGALVALDDSFSWQSMALALQIPTQNSHARSILEREFNTLLEVGVVMLGDCVNSYVLSFTAGDREELWQWRFLIWGDFSGGKGERCFVILWEVNIKGIWFLTDIYQSRFRCKS